MKRSRHSPQRVTYKSVARMQPPSPRRGSNSRKQDDARKERQRAKRAGTLQKVGRSLRTVVIALFVLGVLGAGSWAGWQAFERNGFLSLREVDVQGNRLWDKNALLEKAGVELGVKLPMVPVGKIETALRALPGMGDVTVRRIYPSRLEIRISEQEPVAMGRARGWKGLAPDGTALPGLDLRESDLPVIDGFAAMGADTRARVGAFLDAAKRGYPALYSGFSQLASRGGDDVEIVLRDGRWKVLLDASNKSLSSLEFLQALLRQQGGSLEAGKVIDMRVEGYAYVR